MPEMSLRNEVLTAAVVLALAALVRTGVAARNPMPAGDGVASELEMARNLLDGRGWSTQRKWTLYDPSMASLRPEGNRQPAMSTLLALAFLTAGVSFRTAQVVSLLLGIGALLAAWWWARRTFGRAAALASLAWLSLDPAMVWFSTQPDSLLLFTALFFVILASFSGSEPTIRISVLAGLLSGVSYLARTQGLVLGMSLGLWVLLRGGRGRLARASVFACAFLAVALPWFLRNADAFGSPLYSQNGQFLLNENHWAAWEVRDTAPDPWDMLRHGGVPAVARALAAGVFRVIEPLTIGTLHRGEVFGWPPLVLFTACALLALRTRGTRRLMTLPAFASVPMAASLVLHEHAARYLLFLTTIVICLGIAGAVELTGTLGPGRRWRTALAALAALLLVRPAAALLGSDTRARAAEAAEMSRWISENTEPDDWVVTFPGVELMIWDYRRPTLTMPNDYEMLLWPCLEEHGVRYVVVDPDLPVMRPRLSSRWRMAPDGSGWEVVDPPPFLTEVHRSRSGRTLVYEWTGSVPEGFMYEENLPRETAGRCRRDREAQPSTRLACL